MSQSVSGVDVTTAGDELDSSSDSNNDDQIPIIDHEKGKLFII